MESISELESILLNAPEGATHYDYGVYYRLKLDEWQFYRQGWYFCDHESPIFGECVQSLSDIKQILALTKELEEVKAELPKAFIAGFKASGEGFNGEYPFEDSTDDVIADELRGSIHCYLKGVTNE